MQTSWSLRLEQGWTPWELIQIHGLPHTAVDLYFFAVEVNPVDPTTLLALFPISQPPHACIGLSFSRDGVAFSRPVSLRLARGGWRTSNANGTGSIEWRSEDHPAAGVIVRNDSVWFYIHVAVVGTSLRAGMRNESALVRHRMQRSTLVELTEQSLRSGREGSSTERQEIPTTGLTHRRVD